MKSVKKIKHIEVKGNAIYAMVGGFTSLAMAPKRLLVDHGIGRITATGDYVIGHDDWYPLINWLKAYDKVSEYYNEKIVFNIGCQIPKYADFPPEITTIEAGLQSIDVAYHMNHKFKGKLMYDSESIKMLEGIGHYGYSKQENENKVISICDNFYPCDMDRGIFTTIARTFQPTAQIIHDNPGHCRKQGAESCQYSITW